MIIKISYFYQIRFFKPNQLPISTAKFDPKWFHNFKDQSFQFVDKNGVHNGVRFKEFAPPDDLGGYCCENCNLKNQVTCPFKSKYLEHLQKLDFENIINKLTVLQNKFEQKYNYNSSELILMVHEAPNNPCSERQGIVDFFASHNIKVEEFTKE